jgi:RNA polymerase II-associated protein 2
MSQFNAPTTEQAKNYKYTGEKPPNPRHLAIALQHANQIQAQKDAQALILDRILELIEFPLSESADPAHPSTADAAALKTALVPFQPADFDNLILERNIEGRCGYALCPREHRKEDPNAKFRILWGPKGSGDNGRGREMKVVPREKLEMWCSDQCAERALYLRVQLAEEPVWERRAVDSLTKPLELLEEARQARNKEQKKDLEREDAGLAAKMKKLTVRDESSSAATSENAKQLALERGDTGPTFRKQGRVDVNVREKDVDLHGDIPAAPVARPGDSTGGSIEGYVPQKTREQLKQSRDHDAPKEEDVLDSI